MSTDAMTSTSNAALFERAQRVIPGGVNSPVRAFNGVGGSPLFIARADGAYLFDVDGKQYTPQEISARILAKAKAEAVIDHPDARGAVIIGCDSSLEFNGEALGKPHQAEIARQRWLAMRGKSGALYSGHWVIDNRSPESPQTQVAVGSVSSAIVHFANLSEREIDAYVQTGEPLKVAGAFTIDGLGGAFLKSIEGDAHTVIGLSLPTLRELVLSLGVEYTSLWNIDR